MSDIFDMSNIPSMFNVYKKNNFEPTISYLESKTIDVDVNTLFSLIDHKQKTAIEFDKIIFELNSDSTIFDLKNILSDSKLIIMINYEPISIFNFSFLISLNEIITDNNSYTIVIPSSWTIGKIFKHCKIKTDLSIKIEIPNESVIKTIKNIYLTVKYFETNLSYENCTDSINPQYYLECTKPFTQLKEVINYEHTDNTNLNLKFFLDTISFTKGFIIEGNITCINKFVIRFNGFDRFEPYDNTLLQTLCYKISDNLHYFSFMNKNNLMDISFDSYVGSLNCSGIDDVSILLTLKNFTVGNKLKIYSVGLNLITYLDYAPYHFMYFNEFSIIASPIYRLLKDKTTGKLTILSKTIRRKLDKEKECCPITNQIIESEYCLCKCCSHAFDYNYLMIWLGKNRTCPMCRSPFDDITKFIKT